MVDMLHKQLHYEKIMKYWMKMNLNESNVVRIHDEEIMKISRHKSERVEK